MKPASLNYNSNDAQKLNNFEEIDKTNNNFMDRFSQKDITEYTWNKEFNGKYEFGYRELELNHKLELKDQIYELEISHYKEKTSLEMQIIELKNKYENCQEEKNNMKSDNTFQSVFSLLLVTVGGLLASSSFIGWIVIVIGFLLLLKDKILNYQIKK
jgi:hypothetical protein